MAVIYSDPHQHNEHLPCWGNWSDCTDCYLSRHCGHSRFDHPVFSEDLDTAGALKAERGGKLLNLLGLDISKQQ